MTKEMIMNFALTVGAVVVGTWAYNKFLNK